MLILLIIESIFLVAYLWYVIHSHASKQVTFYVKTLTLISWLISFSLIIILPLDIYKNEQDLKDTQIEVIWIVLYWLTFLLTWIFLPITLDYEDAGEFTFKQKLFKAIKINFQIYAIFGVLGIAFTIYLLVEKQFTFQALLALTVVLSNALGLLIVTFLLGYAIVAIPKQFFRESNHQIQLNLKYHSINKTKLLLEQESLDLDEILIEILSYESKYKNNEEYQPYIQQILQLFTKEQIEMAKLYRLRNNNSNQLEDLNIDKLSEIHKRSKELTYDYVRKSKKLEILTKQALFIEDIINCDHREKKISSAARPERVGCFGKFIDKFQYYWYVKFWKIIMYSTAIVFIILGSLITLSEIAIFGNLKFNVFIYFINDNEEFFAVQILVLIPLLYVLYCIQYGLLNIRFNRFGFYDYGYTDAPSLLFSATFVSRIAFPLAFNFFWMFNESDADIANVVGNFNFDQYLTEFKLAFPILLVILIICNIFDIYDKLLGALGFERFQFEIGFADEHTEEGQEYVQKFRLELSNSQIPQNINQDMKQPFL
ncbi:unnamed protein product [Paramecium sonneborni]|uniref:Uncharacterized protein n=1 Tax=Paramecium sonneborni TaxID=65129 RepID=A0A8S1KB35_9CILI|nr:unnamed protein product [Paramecium sonneborni]